MYLRIFFPKQGQGYSQSSLRGLLYPLLYKGNRRRFAHRPFYVDDAVSERNKKLQFVTLELGSTELLKLTCCARCPFLSPFHCCPTN